jgi:hypothetical protein
VLGHWKAAPRGKLKPRARGGTRGVPPSSITGRPLIAIQGQTLGSCYLQGRCRGWTRMGNGSASNPGTACLCEVDASSVLFEGPKRFGAANDRGRRERPKVAAVERAGFIPVHEEHFTMSDDATVLPYGERPTTAVALACHRHLDSVDHDGKPLRQTVCPGSASTRLMSGRPRGR